MPREGTKTFSHKLNNIVITILRLNMPREGTKTNAYTYIYTSITIEIRYAPRGDENFIFLINNLVNFYEY